MCLSLPIFFCGMRHQRLTLNPRHFGTLDSSQPTTKEEQRKCSSAALDSVYDAWLASRMIPQQSGTYLAPGTQRRFGSTNARLALIITQHCAYDLFKLLMGLHPIRTALMMSLSIVRSLLPAFRGYWQALALNEVCFLLYDP